MVESIQDMVKSKQDTDWKGIMTTAGAVLTAAGTIGTGVYTLAEGYKLMREAAVIIEPIKNIKLVDSEVWLVKEIGSKSFGYVHLISIIGGVVMAA